MGSPVTSASSASSAVLVALVLTTGAALATLAPQPAQAGVVLTPGDGDATSAREVRRRGGGGAEALDAQETLAKTPPAMLGGGGVSTCQSEGAIATSVDRALEQAEAAVVRRAYDEATVAARAAANALLCTDEGVTRTQIAQVYLLRGLVAERHGLLDLAERDYRAALRFEPDSGWGLDIPPEAQPFLDSVRAQVATESPESVSMDLLADLSSITLVIDGNEVPTKGDRLDLTEGAHFAQLVHPEDGTEALELHLEADSTPRFVVPSTLSTAILRNAASGGSREDLDDLLEIALPRGEEVFVAFGSSVWHTKAGSRAWTRVPPPPGRRLRKVGAATVAAGVVASTVLFAVGASKVAACRRLITNDDPSDDDATCAPGAESYQDIRTAQLITNGVPAVGLATVAIGAAMTWNFRTRSRRRFASANAEEAP